MSNYLILASLFRLKPIVKKTQIFIWERCISNHPGPSAVVQLQKLTQNLHGENTLSFYTNISVRSHWQHQHVKLDHLELAIDGGIGNPCHQEGKKKLNIYEMMDVMIMTMLMIMIMTTMIKLPWIPGSPSWKCILCSDQTCNSEVKIFFGSFVQFVFRWWNKWWLINDDAERCEAIDSLS